MKIKQNKTKEFWKPTKDKIILTIFLIIVLAVYVSITSSTGRPDTRRPTPLRISEVLWFLPFFFFENINTHSHFQSWLILIFVVILELLYLYMISCVLIGLYKKLIAIIKNEK